MVKELMPEGWAGFWLLHAEELLFMAEDQSILEADVLVLRLVFCAGRYGTAEGAEGWRG